MTKFYFTDSRIFHTIIRIEAAKMVVPFKIKNIGIGCPLPIKLCLFASTTLLFLMVLSLDNTGYFQEFNQVFGTPALNSSSILTSGSANPNGTNASFKSLPGTSPLFIKCNESSKGSSSLPGLNATASLAQVLTDRNSDTALAGSATFDIIFEDPLTDMPGPDLIINETGSNQESYNIAILSSDNKTLSSQNTVGPATNSTDSCGNQINTNQIDFESLVPSGSAILGIRIDNDPDRNGGADISDLTTVNFGRLLPLGDNQSDTSIENGDQELNNQIGIQNRSEPKSSQITEIPSVNLTALNVENNTATQIGSTDTKIFQIDKETEFLVYNNTDYGVSMLYPSNWTKSEENLQSHQLVGFYAPDVTKLKKTFSPVHFSISVEPVEDPPISSRDYSKQFLGKYYSNASDSKIVNESSSTLSGHNAQRIVMLDFLNGQTFKELRVFSIIDANVYRLGYFAEPGAFMTYLPLIETMIASFNVTSQYPGQLVPVDTNMSEPMTTPPFDMNMNEQTTSPPFDMNMNEPTTDSPAFPEDSMYGQQDETSPMTTPPFNRNTNEPMITSPAFPEDSMYGQQDETNPLMSPTQPGMQACQQLTIVTANASDFERDPKDYHPPSDAADGDPDTWWSNKAKESWLQVDLGQVSPVCDVTVQWNKGDIREYSFTISVSQDGNVFSNAFEGSNNKGSLDPETYEFAPIDARYVKLTITGTSSDKGWASIREVSVNSNGNS
jgi:hypothetical protein